MFNTKTLFILGAGASAPYGYPIGKQLIQNIIDDMEDFIFIPKYQSKKRPPYWNENDKKNNVLYSFNLCEQELGIITPFVDKEVYPIESSLIRRWLVNRIRIINQNKLL